MSRAALSLAIVGADHPNKRGPGRRFEIALCAPGDPVQLVHEPKNKHDANAIQVMSERGVCMGYVSADRTSIVHHAWRDAREVRAIFQAKSDFGAWVRVTLDGSEPTLPAQREADDSPGADPDAGFWPDDLPPDE